MKTKLLDDDIGWLSDNGRPLSNWNIKSADGKVDGSPNNDWQRTS
jgi:hypothetical protein